MLAFMHKSLCEYIFACVYTWLFKMWDGLFVFPLLWCAARGMFLFDFLHRECLIGHEQTETKVSSVFLTLLEKTLSPQRQNIIQSVKERQREMHEHAGTH